MWRIFPAALWRALQTPEAFSEDSTELSTDLDSIPLKGEADGAADDRLDDVDETSLVSVL